MSRCCSGQMCMAGRLAAQVLLRRRRTRAAQLGGAGAAAIMPAPGCTALESPHPAPVPPLCPQLPCAARLQGPAHQVPTRLVHAHQVCRLPQHALHPPAGGRLPAAAPPARLLPAGRPAAPARAPASPAGFRAPHSSPCYKAEISCLPCSSDNSSDSFSLFLSKASLLFLSLEAQLEAACRTAGRNSSPVDPAAGRAGQERRSTARLPQAGWCSPPAQHRETGSHTGSRLPARPEVADGGAMHAGIALTNW